VLVRAGVILVALLVAAVTPAAAAAAPTKLWHMRLFASADGSDIRFTTIAEDGAAAGLRVAPDGTPEALYTDGKKLKNFGSKLGPVSAFTALNDRHQAAGYFSSNPAARVTNLFGSNPDPSLMPHAFFMSGKTIKRITLPSVAFGVNISGWVSGTFRANDGLLHGFLWLPLSKRRPNFADLGPGDARALADLARPRRAASRSLGPYASGAPAGLLTIVGGPTIWLVNPLNGKTTRRTLPEGTFLQSASNTGKASGGQDHLDGSRSPVVYDVARDRVSPLTLPAGREDGFAGGIARSSWFVAGSTSTGTDMRAHFWWSNGRSLGDPNSLPGIELTKGFGITNTPAVADTGLLAGFGTTALGRQEGVIVYPPPYLKLPRLLESFDAYIFLQYPKHSGRANAFRRKLKRALKQANRNRKAAACRTMRSAANTFLDIQDAIYDDAVDLWRSEGARGERLSDFTRSALGIEIRQAIAEFGDELGCKGLKLQLGLLPVANF